MFFNLKYDLSKEVRRIWKYYSWFLSIHCSDTFSILLGLAVFFLVTDRQAGWRYFLKTCKLFELVSCFPLRYPHGFFTSTHPPSFMVNRGLNFNEKLFLVRSNWFSSVLRSELLLKLRYWIPHWYAAYLGPHILNSVVEFHLGSNWSNFLSRYCMDSKLVFE